MLDELMAEKREGQELIRFYLPQGKRSLFREYCQFIDSNMTDELEAFIDECLSDQKFRQYLAMKKQLRSGSDESSKP
ncbi:hypothetical protein [Phormidesmis priestleyi]